MPDEQQQGLVEDKNLTSTNIMGKALDKFHAEQEEAQGLAETEFKAAQQQKQQPDGQQKEGAPTDEDDEAEIDAIKVDEIKTKAGLPISENAKEKFKKLENSRNKWRSKVQEYEKKVAEFEAKLAATNTAPSDLENIEEFKKLKEENQKLKQTQDLLFFEESDEWKNTFENPINAVTSRINSIIGSAVRTITSSQKGELTNLLTRANALLGNPDAEVEYDTIIDEIHSNILTGTSGAKLSSAMQEVWKLAIDRQQAKKDRAAAREKITSAYKEKQTRSRQSLEELLSVQQAAFEQTPVGKAFSQTFADKFGYKENVEVGKKRVIEAIDAFVKTGIATPELSEALYHASLKNVHDRERDFLLGGYNDMIQVVETQKKQIADLEKRIKELRGGTGEEPSKGGESKKKTTNGPTSLASKLEEAINSFGR